MPVTRLWWRLWSELMQWKENFIIACVELIGIMATAVCRTLLSPHPRASDALRRIALQWLMSTDKWIYEQKSLNNRLILSFIGMLSGDTPQLYEFQDILPHLPVPSLKETCGKYIKSLQPHIADDELMYTKELVKEFTKPGGDGEMLQKVLVERQKVHPSNWLEEWWENLAYLCNRIPLVIHSNWYGLDNAEPFTNDQTLRAATFIYGALQFRYLVDSEELEPVRMFGTVPMCMHQYRRLFGTARVPGRQRDVLKTSLHSSHIVVLRRGHIFSFDVYDRLGKQLNVLALQEQIRRIVTLSDSMPPGPEISVLTAENRTTWATVREDLLERSAVNRESMRTVETAAFVVCLDEGEDNDLCEYANRIFHNRGRNRWFDKSFQVVVTENGQAAPNVEHSWGDAPVAAFFVGYVMKNEALFAEEATKATPLDITRLPQPELVDWELEESHHQAIASAIVNAEQLTSSLDLKIVHFAEFGKSCPKWFRVSPDAFIQCALQLAYYRRNNRPCLTHEAAQTRRFLRGRTETVRSCSTESLAFVRAMDNPDAPVGVKISLLRKACKAHVREMRECMNGRGIDRHMFGLKVLAHHGHSRGLIDKMPPIFNDKAFTLPFRLTSSQTPVPVGPGGGFGAPENGYGVSYLVREHEFYFHITSFNNSQSGTDSAHFGDTVRKALNDMRLLLKGAPRTIHRRATVKTDLTSMWRGKYLSQSHSSSFSMLHHGPMTLSPTVYPSTNDLARYETNKMLRRQRSHGGYGRQQARSQDGEDGLASGWALGGLFDVDTSAIERYFQRMGS